MKVLLTGATGYLGRVVAERLVAERAHVRALVRSASATVPAGVELAVADLAGEDRPIASALDGVDAVVHCAAHMGGGDRDVFRRVTVHGTERLLRLAVRAGVRRVVHVSSIAVYGWKLPGSRVEPHDAYDPCPELCDHYAWSKIEAERWVQLYRTQGLLDAIVLRPGIIYGRGRCFLARFARRLRGPLHVIGGHARMRLPLVHVADVADAIWKAVVCPHPVARALNVVGSENPTQAEYLRLRASARSERVVPLYLPFAPVRWAARRMAEQTRFGIGAGRSLVYALASMAQEVSFDLRPASEEIGWSPQVSLAEGLRS